MSPPSLDNEADPEKPGDTATARRDRSTAGRLCRKAGFEGWLRRSLILLVCCWLLIVVVMPLGELFARSLHEEVTFRADDGGVRVEQQFVGLQNYRKYFSDPSLYNSLLHSVFVAAVTTVVSVTLAFVYAYGLTRVVLPLRAVFQVVALLPLFAPTMLYGLSLVYLFGRQGAVTTGLFGHAPFGIDIHLYGPVGIILSEVAFTFPPSVIILSVALSNMDARLYEAARSLGASTARVFFSVTLPGVRFGLASAISVAFVLSFTDFGAPKVVGGSYNVLAVDIYKQVVGQQNFGMGATVSLILLGPALVSFIVDRVMQRRQNVSLTARSVPLQPSRRGAARWILLAICGAIALYILLVVGMGGVASLVRIWPYDMSLSFANYDFGSTGSRGLQPYWNSLRMACWTALFGTIVAFLSAYLIEKSSGVRLLRQAGYLLSILPLALPGLVIGISYIFFFNRADLTLPGVSVTIANPLNALYGAMALLVLSNIVHFYTVSFLTATTALRQLDREFEAVSESMSVPFWITFRRVTVPVCLPAILEIAAYYFVSAMSTVSAVIFLYSAETRPASVAVVNMDDAGDQAQAAALCVLIVGTNIGVRVAIDLLRVLLRRRLQGWRAAQPC